MYTCINRMKPQGYSDNDDDKKELNKRETTDKCLDNHRKMHFDLNRLHQQSPTTRRSIVRATIVGISMLPVLIKDTNPRESSEQNVT